MAKKPKPKPMPMPKPGKGCKRFIGLILIMLCLTMTSCATVSLPKDATPQQRADAKAVDCAAAQQTITEATKTLADLSAQGITKGDAVTYWTLSLSGARLAMSLAGCAPVAQ